MVLNEHAKIGMLVRVDDCIVVIAKGLVFK